MAGPQDFWGSQRPRCTVKTFSECRQALDDPRLTSDPYTADVTDQPSHNLLMMSGHPHRALRGLLNPFLSSVVISRLSPGLAAVRDHHLRELLAADAGDLIADFVEPLVCHAALESIGVLQQARPAVAPLLRSMLGMLEPDNDHGGSHEAIPAGVGIAAVMRRHGRDGRAAGLYRELLEAHRRGAIAKEDVHFALPVVLHGGYENPLNYLGSLVALAVHDPARFRAAVRAWPGRVIEETLRLSPPARGVARWATAEYPTIGALAGDPVWIDLESANRDPEQFGSMAEPDYEHASRHLAFGHGAHRCPGAHLARLLARLVIDGLLELPDAALSGAVIERRVGVVGNGVAAAEVAGLRTSRSP